MIKNAEKPAAGVLYIVGTPIGNLEDISLRAVNTLKNADLVLAEDTRLSRRLLTHYGIETPMLSCHEHNETERAPEVLARLTQGQAVALISDAGTPAVSDPGFRLVKLVANAGFTVIPIPGPCAAIAAVSAGGLPSSNFAFIGFTPKKAKAREEFLQKYISFPGTLIFYESPRRVGDLLTELKRVFGDRPAVLARELTKIYEEFLRGSLTELYELVAAKPALKGECVILVDNSAPPANNAAADADRLDAEIAAALQTGETGASTLAKTLSQKYNLPKTEVYRQILRQKENGQ